MLEPMTHDTASVCPERAHEMMDLVSHAAHVLRELEPSWPMARNWIDTLQNSLTTAGGQAGRADVSSNSGSGILTQNAIDGPLGPTSLPHPHQLPQAIPAPPSSASTLPVPPQWTHAPQSTAEGLHALALAAAEQPIHYPSYTPTSAQVCSSMQYADMPFGDPSQQHSFHDVLAFMSGEPQWVGR
jgi:hypothetical protein